VAELALRVEGGPTADLPPITPTSREDELPLSFAQQRLWFLDQMGTAEAYNMPICLRLKGTLDREALRRAFEEIVKRHESLRTTFASRDGRPHQVIHDVPAWELRLIQPNETRTDEEREATARRLATEELARPFDLSRDLPLRTRLLELDRNDHLLLATLHHIASDGWSLGVLTRELQALYTAFVKGEPSPLPELPTQYADFAAWQRQWLRGDRLERELSYWREQLRDCTVLELPTDRPRSQVPTYAGAIVAQSLPSDLREALERLSQSEGATLYMTMLAAFQILMSRYTGQTDVVVGSPIANRNRREIEGLVGFFVNSLAMRSTFADDPTFRELLRRVRKTTLEAYAHQDLPIEKLVEDLAPHRSLGGTPLFNVMFAIQNAPFEELELPGLTLAREAAEITTTRFDMEWHVWEHPGDLTLVVFHRTDLFERATIEKMIRGFEFLLRRTVADVETRVRALVDAVVEFEDRLHREWLVDRRAQDVAGLKKLKRRADRPSE
jgi:Condensation domain